MSSTVTFALLGDTPYGDDQRVQFPALVDQVNADPKIRFVLHAGDIKNGSSTCDDGRFADLAGLYDTFEDPFVLTPGDNEWTDCHRVAAGSFLPTERLTALRAVFYPEPGRTTGRREMNVDTQADEPAYADYVENVRFTQGGVTIAALHVVGSDNGLLPWSGLPGGDLPAEREAEFAARTAAALAWIDETFDAAQRADAPGVLLLMQAEPVESPGFSAVRQRIVERSTEYGRPVLLVHGDEHIYEVEPAYAGVPNLTRLETYGATATEWLKVTIDRKSPTVFSWHPMSVS